LGDISIVSLDGISLSSALHCLICEWKCYLTLGKLSLYGSHIFDRLVRKKDGACFSLLVFVSLCPHGLIIFSYTPNTFRIHSVFPALDNLDCVNNQGIPPDVFATIEHLSSSLTRTGSIGNLLSLSSSSLFFSDHILNPG
jgi:hypothetical protein